jgi:hypothetical protein
MSDQGEFQKTHSKGAADYRGFAIAIGLTCYALAIVEMVSPSLPTGRWGWLLRPLHEWFGVFGPVGLYFLAGTGLLFSAWKRKSSRSDSS